jgi:hypothetical protein
MGVILLATGALVFALRFYVAATGGMPEVPKVRRTEVACGKASPPPGGAPSSPASSAGGAANVCLVVPGSDLAPRSPKVADP